MKKRLSLMLMVLLAALGMQAQVIAYTVQTTNATYEDITGGTVIDLQGNVGTDLSKVLFDNDGNANFLAAEDVTAFPIGFDFGYDGKTMKYFLLTGDGAVLLFQNGTVSTDVHVLGTTAAANILTNDQAENMFGVIVRQGAYGLDDTEISYKVEGTEGQRVLVIQYKNLGWQSNAWDYETEIAKSQIQYRLYEATGNIEMKVSGFKPYDNANVGNYMWMRAGIVGDKQDYLFLNQYNANGTNGVTQNNETISYGATSYPADGTTWTFVAPEPCVTPAVAPTALELSSTTSAVSGKFTAGSADSYLVLISDAAELSAQPADKTKYQVGNVLGNATVAAIVYGSETIEFATPYGWKASPATTYYVFVYAYNSLCSAGPLYNATPATASVVTKPAAPAAIAVDNVETNSFSISVTPAGSSPVLVAITDKQATNEWDEPIAEGAFGQPQGIYAAGDAIDGGGNVVFYGTMGGSAETTQVMAELGLANGEDLTSYTMSDGTTISFSQNDGNNAPKYYANGTNARVYALNSMLVASASTIQKVVLNVTAGYAGNEQLYAETAEGQRVQVVKDETTITIDGINSTSVNIVNDFDRNSGGTQLRIVSLTVSTAAGEAEPIVVDGLVAGKAYYVRAWSSDGQGSYSSEFIDAATVTSSFLPWEAAMAENIGYEAYLPGWTKHNDDEWSSSPEDGYIYYNASFIEDPEQGATGWIETPYVILGQNGTKMKVQLGGTGGFRGMSDWTFEEGEKVVFQLTKDGENYVDVFTVDQNTTEKLLRSELTQFTTMFNELAGEKVRLRILARRTTTGQVRIGQIVLEEVSDCEAPIDLRLTSQTGSNATIEWTPAGEENAWEVSYKNANDEQWSEPQLVSEPKAELTNLQGATSYQVRVRALCSETSQSSWSEVFTFKTSFSVPFETDFATDDLSDWSTFAGLLDDEATELMAGGDLLIGAGRFGGSNHVYHPNGTESHSWLVSPSISLGDNANNKYEASLTYTTEWAIVGEGDFSIKALVINDGENFKTSDVIGTIGLDEQPAEDEQKTYTFKFNGFTGNIRLAFYFTGQAQELPWLMIDKAGINIDTTTTGIETVADHSKTQVYNLQGVRVSQPTKGLYIVNGKKIIVK